ncbi:hypothetical protein CLCR_04465 [Cladophialophora carrionii]|uniref:Uncharacterized protein n=1 Tax=Cladophialophora carrionii TaxID=86049 RepID=A0A1C1CJ51_9EURO|nr:hypothetical protein CLCR_04465 [Cladophialophora carrionii]
MSLGLRNLSHPEQAVRREDLGPEIEQQQPAYDPRIFDHSWPDLNPLNDLQESSTMPPTVWFVPGEVGDRYSIKIQCPFTVGLLRCEYC